jgi:hypothetical protein
MSASLDNVMRRNRRLLRAAAVSVGALSLATAAYAAAPPQYAPLPTVFQGSIDACESLLGVTNGLQNVSGFDAGVAPASPAEGALSAGVCLYSLLRGGTDREGLLKATGDLEQAQNLGLSRSEQATANVLEGLASCQVAQLELNPNAVVLPPAVPPNPPAQTALFCAARQNALASFSRVSFTDLQVAFPASTGLTADGLIANVAACYSSSTGAPGPLNMQWSPQCGNFVADADTINTAVAEAHRQIKAKYFLGATAPITAMFARKSALAAQTLKTSAAQAQDLSNDSARIGSSLNVAGEQAPAFVQVSTDLTNLITAYQDTYTTSTAVVNTFDAWAQGLFVDHGVTMNTTINGKTSDLNGLLNGTTGGPAPGFGDPKNGAKAVIDAAIAALQTRAAASKAINVNARQLCRAYYCELAYKDKPIGASSFTSVCNALPKGDAGGSLCPAFAPAGALCTPNANSLTLSTSAGTTTFSAQSFCSQAWGGTPPAYITGTGMTSANRTACWSDTNL